MRALTSRSSFWLQAASIKAATRRKADRTVCLTMNLLVSISGATGLHGGGLNIYFPGVDDLVLVGFGSLDGLAFAFLDPPKLEVDGFLCVLLYFHGLGLGLVADAARLHLVRPGPEPALRGLELTVDIRRRGMRSLLHGCGGIDHIHHDALEALFRRRLQIGVDELYPAVYFGGAPGEQHRQRHHRDRRTEFCCSPREIHFAEAADNVFAAAQLRFTPCFATTGHRGWRMIVTSATPCLDIALHRALLSQLRASWAPAEGNALPRSMTTASRLAQRFSSTAQRDWTAKGLNGEHDGLIALCVPAHLTMSDASSVLGWAALRDPIGE